MSNKTFLYSAIFSFSLGLIGCGGGEAVETPTPNYRIDTSVGGGGTISPSAITVNSGETASFNITPDNGFSIASVSGCSGNLVGSTYTTAPINNNCTVTASFIDTNAVTYTVNSTSTIGGSITPTTVLVESGLSTQFTITADNNFVVESVEGCDGNLNGNIYTTATILGDCTVSARFTGLQAPSVNAGADQIVDELTTVTLSGSASDSDGTVVSYLWSQTAGTAVTINDGDAPTANFDAPDVVNIETLVFQLQVTDDDGQIATDEIEVTVNPVARGAVSVLAATGMSAVGFPADYVYWSVDEPVIGDAGHVAFLGQADTSIRQTPQNTAALWSGLPDDLQLVIKENDPLPSLPGNVLYGGSINNRFAPVLVVNSNGGVAHFGSLKGAVNDLNKGVLLVHNNNSLDIVMRSGDQAVGLPNGNTYGTLLNYAFSQSGVVFSAEIKRTNNLSSFGIWLWDFNETRLLALNDISRNSAAYDLPQESPNIDGGNCIFASLGLRSLQINDQGDILFDAGLGNKAGASCTQQFPILKWSNDSFKLIVARGQAVDGLNDYKFNRFLTGLEIPLLQPNGDVSLHSTISNSANDLRSFFWVRKANGEQQYLAVGGELLPDSSSQTMSNSLGVLGLSPRADGEGNYLLSAISNNNQEEAYLLKGVPSALPYSNIDELGASGLSTLVKVGDVPPDYPSTAFFSRIYRLGITPSINKGGNVVFFASRADALDTQAQTLGLWHIDPTGDTQKIIEVGDSIAFNGSNFGVETLIFGSDFNFGLERAGGQSQHSDTDTLFVMSRLTNAYQALLLINY